MQYDKLLQVKVPWLETKKIKPIIHEFRASELSKHC